MLNTDLNTLEELAEILQTEVGKDILISNRIFKDDFNRLVKLLKRVNKYSAVPKEVFLLTAKLSQQIGESKKEYDERMQKINLTCDSMLSQFPFLFSQLKEFACSDRAAVETILKELSEQF